MSFTVEKYQQNQKQNQIARCFYKLYGESADSVQFRNKCVSGNSESETAFDAVAASAEKTTDPSENVKQRGDDCI